MLYSIYPTDTAEVIDEVISCAVDDGAPSVFTSLHIPEAAKLQEFGATLERLHSQYGLEFCADISPAGLQYLGIDIEGTEALRRWGVSMLRADYGFSASDIAALASAGFRVAVNASTMTGPLFDELASVLDPSQLSGWHNYYPRPETGLDSAFFVKQTAMFTERGYEVYSFVPGERSFRGPMHLGLPTLESHRYAGAYVAAANTLALCPSVKLVCAEGVLSGSHRGWIGALERGVTTLPLAVTEAGESSAEIVRALRGREFGLRIDSGAASFRIEGTRGGARPAYGAGGSSRRAWSLHVDLDAAGRYAGELHLIRRDLPPSPLQAWVADVASPYLAVAESLAPGARIRFI